MSTTEDEIIVAYPKSADFAWKIVEVAHQLNIDPSWLANIIQSESRFNIVALNADSNAAGLIQFIPSTAQYVIKQLYGINLSKSEATQYVLSLGAVEQLDMARYYLGQYGELKSQSDVVLAVFYPAAIGKEDDFDIADHYARVVRKREVGSTEYWNSYNYLVDINGGINYAGDYEKNLSSAWKLEPAPSYNGNGLQQSSLVPLAIVLGIAAIGSMLLIGKK